MKAAQREVQQLGDELVVHHRETGSVHILNPTAAMIWRAASGGPVDQKAILDQLSAAYPEVSLENLGHDLRQTLVQLRALGLLDLEDPRSEHDYGDPGIRKQGGE